MRRTGDLFSGFLRPGRGVCVALIFGLSLSWTACAGGTGQHADVKPPGEPPPGAPPPTTPAGAIPVSYWGIHVLNVADFPIQLPYGQFRSWDTQAQWPLIETCPPSASSSPISIDPCFNWTFFDRETASLKTRQPFEINDILYTLSRTPDWASTDPTDTTCDGALAGIFGQCHLPSDINADGSGSNQTWKTWVTAIATHANGLDDPTHT